MPQFSDSVTIQGSIQIGGNSAVVSLTTTGAPTTGTWQTGQQVVDSTGTGYRCTAGGTPGTWAATGAYAPLPPGMSFVSGGAPLTRRAQLPIGTPDGVGSTTAGTDYTTRQAIVLPVTTVRHRYKIRNQSVLNGTFASAAIPITGIWEGPINEAQAAWDGSFSAAPTQTVPAFTLDPGGTGAQYVTPWVTGSPFSAFVPKGVSVGISCAGKTIYYSSMPGYSYNNTSQASVQTPLTNQGGLGIFDIVLEYEYIGVTPIGLFLGDSLTAGYINNPGAAMAGYYGKTDSWPVRAGLLGGFCAFNNGVGSSVSGTWASGAFYGWTQRDFATCVPDFAVIALGTNDAGATPLATYQANVEAIVTILQGFGIGRIYVCTVPPANLTGTAEYQRQQYNSWLRTLPLGVSGCIDMDRILVQEQVVTVASVTTTSGSASATVASGGFLSVVAGMLVTGTGIPAGTVVNALSGNTLTLGDLKGNTVNASASGTVTLTFQGGALAQAIWGGTYPHPNSAAGYVAMSNLVRI
jgi:hypothetical protein